jgi:hypothetical protein
LSASGTKQAASSAATRKRPIAISARKIASTVAAPTNSSVRLARTPAAPPRLFSPYDDHACAQTAQSCNRDRSGRKWRPARARGPHETITIRPQRYRADGTVDPLPSRRCRDCGAPRRASGAPRALRLREPKCRWWEPVSRGGCHLADLVEVRPCA